MGLPGAQILFKANTSEPGAGESGQDTLPSHRQGLGLRLKGRKAQSQLEAIPQPYLQECLRPEDAATG